MQRRWVRPVLVTALTAAALLGTAVVLGPWGDDPPAPAAAQPPSPTAQLDAYVARTTAHLSKVPADWQSWAQLGAAHVELARITGDPAHHRTAQEALEKSLTLHPAADNAGALTGLGALAAARHQFTDALSYARQAVTVDAYAADAYGVLADALIELGRYDEGIDAVQRMVDLRPDTGSFARASYTWELRGDVGKARDLMTQALTVASGTPDRSFARTHLADLAFGAGDLDTATAHHTAGLAEDPANPALLAGRAEVRAARGDLTGAAADLRAVTAIRPTVEHAAALAEVLTAAGDAPGAERATGLVAVAARLSPDADIDLVLHEADHGDPAAAVTRGEALFRARPGIGVEMAYAWALHAAGRHAEALPHADHALRLGTRDAHLHHRRGLIRHALGDRTGARADLAAALGINPYFSLTAAPAARTLLAQLGGPA